MLCVTHQAVEHLIQDSPKTPPVHRPVIRLLMEDLRSQILRRATEGRCCPVMLNILFAEPKVSEDDVPLGV